MEEKINWLKIAITGAPSFAGGLFGVQFWLLLLTAGLACLDYITGTWAAKHTGTWSSKVAREGIDHKKGVVVVIIVALAADLLCWVAVDLMPTAFDWPWVWVTMVCVWYCLTEIGSNLENAGKMGAHIPKWFAAAMDAGISIVDAKGEEITAKIAEDKREQEGIENG